METKIHEQVALLTSIDPNGVERNLILRTRNSAKRTFTITHNGFVSITTHHLSDLEYEWLKPHVEIYREQEINLNTHYRV